MRILGLTKTTLLDFPGHVAASLFTGGCQFRCPFCHNGELVLAPLEESVYSQEEVLSFLRKRRGVLQGVCITGGEPTLQPGLAEFIRRIRELGYLVKLDTNGYEPEVLEELLREGLLSYVAMDIKNRREKYALTVGKEDVEIDRIEQSVELLKKAGIAYEFRTTLVKELHTEEDIREIGKWIGGCPYYFLQQYRDSENVIAVRKGGGEDSFHGYDRDAMERMAKALEELPQMTGRIALRGVE